MSLLTKGPKDPFLYEWQVCHCKRCGTELRIRPLFWHKDHEHNCVGVSDAEHDARLLEAEDMGSMMARSFIELVHLAGIAPA